MVYVLDGIQKAYEENQPQSAFQYECYVLDNIPADFMWQNRDDLYFAHNAENGGVVYKFHSDKDCVESYSDEVEWVDSETGETHDKKAIEAFWDLPELYGNLFYHQKTFLFLAVQLNAAIATGFELWAQIRGLWRKVGENFVRGRYFDWSNINWSRFTWSTDQTTRPVQKKFRIKQVDKARYRLLNNELNEPFGIFSIALEYTENGKLKR